MRFRKGKRVEWHVIKRAAGRPAGEWEFWEQCANLRSADARARMLNDGGPEEFAVIRATYEMLPAPAKKGER